LQTFVFNATLKGDKQKDLPIVTFVEGIEAELVYLVRSKTGRWPLFQNEIHFNNDNHEKTKEIALRIYRKVNSTNIKNNP
jgi:hypothetical protein